MIIIFDLDYTLLDTKKFKAGLANALDLSIDDFEKSYLENFKNKKLNYNLEKHLKILKQKNTQKLKQFFKSLDQYLFPDSIKILKKLGSAPVKARVKKNNNKLILLSFGNKEWQKQKINNLSIKDYFDKIILTDIDKAKILKTLQKTKEKILIINDNAREILEMKKVLKNCNIFLTKGPYCDNVSHNLKTHTLNELLHF